MTVNENENPRFAALRLKLWLLALMNAGDWVCTVALTRSGACYEANPLMAPVIGDLKWGFMIKCVLPLAAVWLIGRICRTFDRGELRSADRWVSFAVVFYLAIHLDHLIQLILYLSGTG